MKSMPTDTAKQSLTDTQTNAVLDHLVRYRMTTLAALQAVPAFRRWSKRRLRKLLERLCDGGLLAEAPLYRGRDYYHLTRAGADRYECQYDRVAIKCGPLSETAKVRNYAKLLYCSAAGSYRKRLTVAELREHLPQVFAESVSDNYYYEDSATAPRLGFMRVDTGGSARWDRIVTRSCRDLQSFAAHTGLRPFLDEGFFELVVITAFEQKAVRISQQLEAMEDPLSGLVHVCAIPELVNLIAPPPIHPRNTPRALNKGSTALSVPGA